MGRGRAPREPRQQSRIHQGLVGPRALVGTPYMADPALRAEYQREIAPRTSAALAKILGEVFPARTAGPEPLVVLDLGSGTGAAGAAVREFFGGRIRLTSVDRVAHTADVRAGDVTDVGRLTREVLGAQRFDLVVAAHVLNEVEPERQSADRAHRLARLVQGWCDTLLAAGGMMLLVEPALRETARTLSGVRDLLLAGGGVRVVAPCFFRGPCLALARDRDWCHDAAGRVDFSYLVLRQARGREPLPDAELFRVVSDPMPEKGRLRVFACGDAGRHALVRLDRHDSPANTVLGHLRRGDVVRVSGAAAAADGLRVAAETVVQRSVSTSATESS